MSGAGEGHDAIVIGAGHNGPLAAMHLAAKGWKVAVVERANEAGGAVKTREVTLPGFRHDLFAMNLSPFAGSPFLSAYKETLGGELHLGRAVERIETSGDKATGVRLTGGEMLGARRAVIANAHPKLAFGDLLAKDRSRATYEAKLASFRAGPAADA